MFSTLLDSIDLLGALVTADALHCETRPREVPGRATPRALRVDRKKGSQPILRKQFAELPCAAVPIVDIDASRNAP